MKILIVNTYDITGGAARAAYRLHQSLVNAGINSQMLVQNKSSRDYTVILSNQYFGRFKNRLRNLQKRFFDLLKKYPNKTNTLFSTSHLNFSNIIDSINQINPDIVHLHWICHEMIKIEELVKIKAPIVWSLHDNWAFSGGCHIKWECEKYKDNCGACPRLGSKKDNDLSRWIWQRKQKTFSQIDNLTIVGLSKWITNISKESSLLKNKKHINLPNPIDTNNFKPFGKEKSRSLWNLPQDKKLILFGAMSATSDINKGFKELSEALKILALEDIEFVVFGSNKPQNPPKFKFKTHYLGHLYDDISLVTLYSAVDVMVVPSLQENLSNAIMESLACATPVVGFDVGGNSDMIEHKKNGYLTKPFESNDLANGIEWILNLDENKYSQLCQNARDKVLKNFDSRLVAKKYIKLYEEILKDKILPTNKNHKQEGGLRTEGYFKKSSTDKPLITVLTVVYNGEKHLEQTINSVLNQTYDNIEYIIIDGGSTDGTLDIIKKYENKIDFWVSEPDKGIYDAMNKGVKFATGEYIGFLNADDWYPNDSIELVARASLESNPIYIFGDMDLYNGDKFIDKRKPSIKGYKYGTPIGHQALFVQTNFMRKNPFDTRYKIAADYDLMIKLMKSNLPFVHLNKSLANFRTTGLSSITNFDKEYFTIYKNNFGMIEAIKFYIRTTEQPIIFKIVKLFIKIKQLIAKRGKSV